MSQPVHYILKVRHREQHEVAIRGGASVGPHRRRVQRWGPWETVAKADGPRGAAELYESARYQTYDRAIFYGSNRLTIEQIRQRCKELGGE